MSAESRIWVIERRYKKSGWKPDGEPQEVTLSERDAKELAADLTAGLEQYRAVAYVRETERKG